MVVRYLPAMHRLGLLMRRYALDLVVALLASVALVEIILRPDVPGAPTHRLWLGLAIASLVLAVFARRRFPFAAPLAYWVLAAGFAFVDPNLIPGLMSLFTVGMVVAFLLGNLRDPVQGVIGLAVVVASAFVIVYEIPGLRRPSSSSSRSTSGSAGWAASCSAGASGRPRQPKHGRPSRSESRAAEALQRRHRGTHADRPRTTRRRRTRSERDDGAGVRRASAAPAPSGSRSARRCSRWNGPDARRSRRCDGSWESSGDEDEVGRRWRHNRA